MGKRDMKTILKIAAAATVLASAGLAQAQTPAAQTVPAPAPEPAQAAAPAGEDWNPFSRSTVKVYMADVNSFRTVGDVVSARIARVPLAGEPGDYSYAADEIEMRCAAKQSRTVASIEYGPDGVQTDRYDDPEEWAAYAPDTRDAYLSQLVCDGDRASPPTWPSIRAFIDAGRH
jgi:hypothetical protein